MIGTITLQYRIITKGAHYGIPNERPLLIKYRRSDFECKILLIVNCEFLYKMQSKESQEKNKQWMLHVTTPLLRACSFVIANMHALSTSCVFNLLACMYVQLSIVKNESSILQASCWSANTQMEYRERAITKNFPLYLIIMRHTNKRPDYKTEDSYSSTRE